jgi:hypothetical protein
MVSISILYLDSFKKDISKVEIFLTVSKRTSQDILVLDCWALYASFFQKSSRTSFTSRSFDRSSPMRRFRRPRRRTSLLQKRLEEIICRSSDSSAAGWQPCPIAVKRRVTVKLSNCLNFRLLNVILFESKFHFRVKKVDIMSFLITVPPLHSNCWCNVKTISLKWQRDFLVSSLHFLLFFLGSFLHLIYVNIKHFHTTFYYCFI